MRILPIVLLISLVFTGSCSKQISSGVSVPSAFRPLVPPETRILAAADLDKLKSSAFYQRHRNELNFPLLNGMSERVGLDPRRDLSYILIASTSKAVVVLARGDFKPRDIQQKLISLGMRRTQYHEHPVFGDNRDAVTFERHGILIIGPTESVRSELDLSSGGVPEELQQHLGSISRTDQIWAVSRGDLMFVDDRVRSDIGSALSNITGFISAASLGLGFDAGAHLQAEVVCISEQGAQRVRDALRGGIGLARLTTKDNESELLQAYDAIQVSQDHQTVRINADLSAELADKLLAYLPALRNRAGQAFQER